MKLEGVLLGSVEEATQEVTKERSATHLGSGALGVYATPSMALFVEQVCRQMIDPKLPEGQASVGVWIDLRHLAPTPVGDSVRIRAEIASIEGNLISFKAQIWDSQELIGEALHKRAVIEVDRFLKRVQTKLNEVKA
jgi:fluoroacetyl-CoA thioesterase